MKFLLWGLIIGAIVLWILHSKKRALRQAQRRNDHNAVDAHDAAAATEPMVRCTHCGIYLPASDALPGAAGVYCSNEHRRLAGES